MNKPFILANIDEAIRLVTEQPEELLPLGTYRAKLECGTLYCTAGLCATSAHFCALGWTWRRNIVAITPKGGVRPANDLDCIDTNNLVEDHFGPRAFNNVFAPRCEPWSLGTDKEIALRRLHNQRTLVESSP